MEIFLSATEASKEEHVSLEWMLCIHYLLRFRKNTTGIKVLIDSDSEVNAMLPIYVSQLGLKVHYTDIGDQKIDSSTLETFGMVLASF